MAGTNRPDLVPLAVAMRNAVALQGLTHRALAEKVGLSHTYLGGVMKGTEHPKPATIQRICQALDLDTASIAEWRLASTRRLFDEREDGGVQRAMEALKEYDAAMALLRAQTGGAPRPTWTSGSPSDSDEQPPHHREEGL